MNEVIKALCINCGLPFLKLKQAYGGGRSIKLQKVRRSDCKTCSKECSREWNNKTRKKRGKNIYK